MSLSKKGEGGATVNYNVIIYEICRSQIICFFDYQIRDKLSSCAHLYKICCSECPPG